MKKVLFYLFISSISFSGIGQKYLTQTGTISFYSEATLENIEAENNQVSSVLNMENGELVFSLLMKAFTFEKALMQEHFNEKYVESEIYPKSKFKGQIQDFNQLKLSTEPTIVTINGELTIHGVTKSISTIGELHKIENGNIVGGAVFMIKLDDYKIKIPAATKNNLSNTIKITVKLDYEKLD